MMGLQSRYKWKCHTRKRKGRGHRGEGNVLPNLFMHRMCSKPMSESLVLKQRKLHYREGSPTRRQRLFLKLLSPVESRDNFVCGRRWIHEKRVRHFLKPGSGEQQKQSGTMHSSGQWGTIWYSVWSRTSNNFRPIPLGFYIWWVNRVRGEKGKVNDSSCVRLRGA